jgi:TolB-like protein
MARSAYLALGLLFLIVACTSGRGERYVNAAAPPARAMTVAVLPLENLSTHPEAGQIVSGIFTNGLLARGLFQLREESEIRSALSLAGVSPGRLRDGLFAGDVAKALEVDAVLVGNVSEYRYLHGLKENPTVGLSVRLVDRGGTVMWSASESAVGGGFLNRPSLFETAQSVVGAVIEDLAVKAR